MTEYFPCPCQSSQLYQDCCEPFHLGERTPTSAEQLMRSRYVAYTQANIDYIIATTVPSQQDLLDRHAMQQWAETTKWCGLEVIAHIPNFSKNHSTVEFKAFFQTENERQAHHELSLFVNIEGHCYFVDPTVTLPTKKQPCICGSGKKFKQCCGILID